MAKRKKDIPEDIYAADETCPKCGHTYEHYFQKNIVHNSMSPTEIAVLKKIITDGFVYGTWNVPRYKDDISALKTILLRIERQEPDLAKNSFERELKNKKDKDWE